jgi:hypothetical protein
VSESHDSENISIPIGPGMRAFAAGVKAGEEALAYAKGANTPREQLGAFWMLVGIRLAEKYPTADEEVQTGFAAGAATNAPSRPAVEVIINDVANAAFGEPGDTEADEIGRIIRTAAERIESGDEEGTLRDSNGATVGSFKVSVL